MLKSSDRNFPLIIFRNWLEISLVLSLVLLAALLNGCSPTLKPLPTVEIPKPCKNPPPVDMLHLKPHPPTVIIIDGAEWWVFNTKHYENMGENFQDILKTIRQQKAVINYYQDCTN